MVMVAHDDLLPPIRANERNWPDHSQAELKAHVVIPAQAGIQCRSPCGNTIAVAHHG
jgi:hypothetical protein